MLAAYEACDVELTHYGGEDSILVQTEISAPISGYLSTVMYKHGFNVLPFFTFYAVRTAFNYLVLLLYEAQT